MNHCISLPMLAFYTCKSLFLDFSGVSFRFILGFNLLNFDLYNLERSIRINLYIYTLDLQSA